MSLSAYALATVEELKEFMGSVSGSGVDPNFARALNTASLVVENYLNRRIVSRGNLTEYHTFYRNTPELFLLDWPSITVTNVWEDATRAYATPLVANTDYIVSQPRGLLTRIAGLNGGLQSWARGFRAVKVAYTAGYAVADVPADLKDVTCWIAAHLFHESERKGWDVSSATDGLGTVTRFTMSRLPDYMKAQLGAYVVPVVGLRTGERDA